MQTATISHPGDPLSNGLPPTVVVKKLGRVEATKARADIPKRAYQVEGTNKVVVRAVTDCDDQDDPQFYFLGMKRVVTEVINGPVGKDGKPMPLGDECLYELFDEKYDVFMDVVDGKLIGVSGKTSTSGQYSFPYYIALTYGRGVLEGTLFPDPTPAQSAPL